ncbi:MAG: glutamate--tRNA ligase, partial [Candidatus Nanohaloarchaea archaeon]
MNLEELARKHALENAVEYGGECNPGAVIGKVIAESDADPEEVQEVSGRVCAEINELSLEEQEEAMQDYEYEEEEHEHDPIPNLPGAEEGEVTVRFAPNPNGPPHIG